MGVGVMVGVLVRVGVDVGVLVAVTVEVCVRVGVGVLLDVAVGVGVIGGSMPDIDTLPLPTPASTELPPEVTSVL